MMYICRNKKHLFFELSYQFSTPPVMAIAEEKE